MTRTALYRHYDADGQLLYVGVSASPLHRTADHSKLSDWFGAVAEIKIQWFATAPNAKAAELTAIEAEKPKHNIRHGNRSARRIKQARGSGADNSKLLSRIYAAIEAAGMSRAEFGAMCVNDFGLLNRMEAGSSLRPTTISRIDALLGLLTTPHEAAS